MNAAKILFAVVLLSILDALYLTATKRQYNALVHSVQGNDMKVNWIGALIAYPLMFIGLIFIVFPLVERDTSTNKVLLALKYGGLFGFVVYGIFNATNFAIFRNYSPWMAIQDTLWGTFVFFIVTLVTLFIFDKVK